MTTPNDDMTPEEIEAQFKKFFENPDNALKFNNYMAALSDLWTYAVADYEIENYTRAKIPQSSDEVLCVTISGADEDKDRADVRTVQVSDLPESVLADYPSLGDQEDGMVTVLLDGDTAYREFISQQLPVTLPTVLGCPRDRVEQLLVEKRKQINIENAVYRKIDGEDDGSRSWGLNFAMNRRKRQRQA